MWVYCVPCGRHCKRDITYPLPHGPLHRVFLQFEMFVLTARIYPVFLFHLQHLSLSPLQSPLCLFANSRFEICYHDDTIASGNKAVVIRNKVVRFNLTI